MMNNNTFGLKFDPDDTSLQYDAAQLASLMREEVERSNWQSTAR